MLDSPDRPSPQIAMRRVGLADLPAVVLPEGCSLRTFREGDDAVWDHIIGESFSADNRERLFNELMRPHPEFRPDRVFFVCRGSKPIATASAWHLPERDESIGYLHYVGVLPSETGVGLGLQVSLACLHKMASEGRTAVDLSTDDFRIPAIKTYLKLGFEPLLMHENQRDRWREIFAQMERPELAERYAAVLDGPVRDPRRLR